MSDLNSRILARLDAVGKSPSVASVNAGLSSGAIRDILTGRSKSPTVATLEALCGPLECSLAFLVGCEPEAEEPTPSGMGKFWMVYGMGQRSPTARHYSVSSATAEARRLAQSNVGTVFVVLEALCAVMAEQPRIIAIDVKEDFDDGIPF